MFPTSNADQAQLSPAVTLKGRDPAPNASSEAGGPPERVYEHGLPEPGSATFQTPRPCVNANSVLWPALRSSTSVSVTALANGLSSRAQVPPPSSETKTPMSV